MPAVAPYLFFDGRCEEALEFYKAALGAEATLVFRFGDAPPQPGAPTPPADKIMHATMRVGPTTVFLSDGHCAGQPSFAGFAISLSADDDAQAQRMFDALADGGKITTPMGETFFAARFGMLDDRHGVSWMVMSGPKA